MPRTIKRLNITDMSVKDEDGVRTYKLIANNIRLKVEVPESDIRSHKRPEILKAVNDRFLNSLRFIKHTGDLPNKPDDKELNKWSSTEWGLAIKPKNDEIKEFPRFE